VALMSIVIQGIVVVAQLARTLFSPGRWS